MEKFKYIINGKNFRQEELNILQDEAISDLFEKLNISDLSDFSKLQIAKIVRLLFKEKILSDFLAIILIPDINNTEELSHSDVQSIKNSQLVAIVTDFFSLNPYLSELLANLGKNLDLLTLNSNLNSSNTNSGAKKTTQGSSSKGQK